MKFLANLGSEDQKAVIDEIINETERDIFRNALRVGLNPETVNDIVFGETDNPHEIALVQGLKKLADLAARKARLS